jgi:hypothetical protein
MPCLISFDTIQKPAPECRFLHLIPSWKVPATLVLRPLDECDVAIRLKRRDPPLHQLSIFLGPLGWDLNNGLAVAPLEPSRFIAGAGKNNFESTLTQFQ